MWDLRCFREIGQEKYIKFSKRTITTDNNFKYYFWQNLNIRQAKFSSLAQKFVILSRRNILYYKLYSSIKGVSENITSSIYDVTIFKIPENYFLIEIDIFI